MTCDQFQKQLAPYLSRKLTASQCEALELHASTCSACEVLLKRATDGLLPAFSPALPTELRAPVLQAVASRRNSARATRWTRVAALVGAAALLALMLKPTGKHAPLLIADSTTTTTAAHPLSTADDRSRSEFLALDDAARELETAIARTPDDKQLSAFLQSVTERRAELQRRVKDARL